MSREMDRITREAAKRYGPPPATPEDALAHVLCGFANLSDDHVVVKVTDGIYGDGVVTGLTMGDLKAIQRRLDAIEQPTDARIVPFPGRN